MSCFFVLLFTSFDLADAYSIGHIYVSMSDVCTNTMDNDTIWNIVCNAIELSPFRLQFTHAFTYTRLMAGWLARCVTASATVFVNRLIKLYTWFKLHGIEIRSEQNMFGIPFESLTYTQSLSIRCIISNASDKTHAHTSQLNFYCNQHNGNAKLSHWIVWIWSIKH